MALVQQAGGTMNGSTADDRTNYWQTLPSNRLNLGLWLEADRMRSLAVTRENFENQRETVKEERRLRIDNQPYTGAFLSSLTSGFDAKACFGYAHETIGSMDDLNAAKTEDVQQFFRTYYVPNNATLVVVVSRPTFSDQEFELARTQTLSGLQLEASNPASIATRFFTAGLYGTHPYGRSQTAKSVRAITRGDLLGFHGARVKPRGALLVVAGDINMTSLKSLVEKGFAGWTGAAAAPLPLPLLPNRKATEIVLVHRPGSVQSNLLVGNLALGAADTLRYSASLANRILGGASDSRLFVVLREQKSWTYGAYSRITRLRGVGRFEANAEVRTPQQLAERVATVKLYGLAPDYLQTYRTRLAAEKVAQVQIAAKRIIKPSQAFIVVVGDGSKIYDKLKAIAPVKTVSVDGDPMMPSDFTPKALGTALNFSNLVASRDSFVVVMQGRTIGTSVQSVEARSGGWTVRESTNVMNGMMAQQTALETDASLASTSLVQSASMQGQVLKTNVAFAGGRATGSAMSASQADTKYTLNVFNSGTGTVQPMVLTVQGSETVTVPAGTFETWKVEQKRPESSAIIYITKDAARRIVKIAPVGQPIEILLAK